MEETKGTTAAGGKRTVAPPAAAESRPAADVPAAAESGSATAARELREAAEQQGMSEGVRQDVLQGGSATDPITGRKWTVDDLSADDKEAYRRAHADRTDR